jgi:hypothetical protein
VSYCRFGEDGSDVYVIRDWSGHLVCYCGDEEGQQETETGMLNHLLSHMGRGEKVPTRALDRLRREEKERQHG